MKIEVYINPNYAYLNGFVNQIPEKFECLGEELHSGRNEIRVVDNDGFHIVVKYFKRITLANRILYATIRKSKARRAYEHSQLLLKKGITSPDPIAYINIYRAGILYKSYYLSLFTFYKPLRELFECPIIESEEGLKSFARFTYRLHSNGFLHKDYNVNNILYFQSNNEYDFSLIDNNRMRFRSYSYLRSIQNLERLKIPVDRMGIIANEYAQAAYASDIRTLNGMIYFRLRYLFKVSLEKWIKSLLHIKSFKNRLSHFAIHRNNKPIESMNG